MMTYAEAVLATVPVGVLRDLYERHIKDKAEGRASPTALEQCAAYVERYHALNPHLWGHEHTQTVPSERERFLGWARGWVEREAARKGEESHWNDAMRSTE